jgi:membrane protein
MLNKTKSFITEDIWRLRRKDLPKSKSIGLKFLRVILHAAKGFNDDRCALGASALTFFTLLSIVPLFAMAFGIAQGFGLEQLLEDQITANIQGQEEVIAYIMEFSKKMLDNTSGGLIAGIGVVFLFFTVIRLLGNIEMSLNGIWGVKEPRTWVRKFSDYLAIMVVSPVLMILASSLNVYIVGMVREMTDSVELLGVLRPLIFFLIKFSPFLVLWLLFSFIYVVIPNTRVNLFAGLIGGIAGGSIFQIFQLLYIHIMSGMMSNSAVYGSFAALPLFLFWLQISWQILLFGAEISFAYQNVDTYELEPDAVQSSRKFKKLASLKISSLVVKSFVAGREPISESEIQDTIELPLRLVKELLFDLVRAKVLVEIRDEMDKEITYVPATDPEKLTVGYVISSLENFGKSDLPMHVDSDTEQLQAALDEYESWFTRDRMALPLKGL